MDKLYTVHRYFNQACSNAGIKSELLVNEDDLKVILSVKPITEIAEGLRRTAIANGIIVENRNVPSGTMVVITSNPKINISSTIASVESRFGKFYRKLDESFGGYDPWKSQSPEDAYDEELRANGVCPACGEDMPCFCDEEERDAKGVPQAESRRGGPDTESICRTDLRSRLDEALNGIAVPDGAAQPKVGVEMLNQALAAKTKSGITLKDALKKQGITWHVAEPGSHIIVFKGKSGDEKWRVEPMTLSDKKVFEATMEALWSVALGKSPNAKELEREAAKQRAKELSDHQKEISGLVDQITGKYAPPAEQEQKVE